MVIETVKSDCHWRVTNIKDESYYIYKTYSIPLKDFEYEVYEPHMFIGEELYVTDRFEFALLFIETL